jgi:hypothetical protein
MRRSRLFPLALLLLIPGSLPAAPPPPPPQVGGGGIVYADGIAFSIAAPTGWVLDNHSGVQQGLPAVLYPEGSSWKDAATVMYPNAARRTADRKLTAFIAEDLDRYRAAAPDLRVETLEPQALRDGRKAEIRKLTEKSLGNVEAVAYLEEPGHFILLVLSTRSEDDFAKALPAFRELLGSYEYLTDQVRLPLTP